MLRRAIYDVQVFAHEKSWGFYGGSDFRSSLRQAVKRLRRGQARVVIKHCPSNRIVWHRDSRATGCKRFPLLKRWESHHGA